MVEMQYARAIIARNDAWIAWQNATNDAMRLDAIARYIKATNTIMRLAPALEASQAKGSQS